MSLRDNLNEEAELAVGDSRYVLIPEKENFLSDIAFEADAADSEVPLLVLVYKTTAEQTITQSALREFRANVLDKDDVIRSEFWANVVFYGAEEKDINIAPEACDELAAWNVQNKLFAAGNPAAEAGSNGRVIVPSRSYYNPSPLKPLHGARISVKDNIDIAGHKTTLCNRAWIDLYPAKTEHADCVETVIDAGAVIVGKVKLQAMIMREEPLECVEFTAPFNPRADGYQVPSGSSHASAAGIGSYDWLDFSFGSDTNGSGRKPASYNGCFSIRPSTGLTNNKGVVGYFPQFDMPVFFGRDISRFSGFISTWYGHALSRREPEKGSIRILYPSDYLPTPNLDQTRVIDNFVSGLESALGVKRTNISLADIWRGDCPDGKEHDDIAKYLETAGIYPFYHDQYHNSADFRNQYKEKYGKPPFVHRALHWQWDVGKKISQEERDECWRRSELYREWLLNRVFRAHDEDSLAVMILPIEAGKPNYRDSEPPPNGLLSGYAALNMSPMTRSPEVTAPVGDIPYHSIVTEREERLPVAVSLIGPPGTDLLLVDLVEKGMKGAGLPTEVKTGSLMF
ncbi:hypothetical protein CDV55_107783 [Aspergillus turcosus]|uniref:Amidase domain-containing protein n=1 Tax=Aspergillus turcosus TaxID=1245748 RepID=A0A229YXZ6_9EURO|nr:hypothetical protein CDV55_107783 [Aspergillus turcosus]RLL93732.1 hypothetical protein CFD26_101385 [Aspergillus turcosus]